METSDLLSDANNANATIALNCPTESKSVKRRSCQPPRSHRMTQFRVKRPFGIDTCISLPVSTTPGSMAGTKTMGKLKTFPHCMTLRLDTRMESELETLAFDRHVSKAGFIRRCIRQAIADAYRHGTQNTQNQGAL